jgi:hypothetical protein
LVIVDETVVTEHLRLLPHPRAPGAFALSLDGQGEGSEMDKDTEQKIHGLGE